MPKVEATKGYILEEVLAKLLKNAGYDLISGSLEPANLKLGPHGLQVRGRGAWHQVDSLGQFRWTPPFNFPIRLFLEAKFRRSKSGVDLVRQAIGISADVNQRVSVTVDLTDASTLSPDAMHRYSYALASTKGFTPDAAALALAHQISLIDLSLPEYQDLLSRIGRLAESAVDMWEIKGGAHMAGRLANLRNGLRARFDTLPIEEEGKITDTGIDDGDNPQIIDAQQIYSIRLKELEAAVDTVGELFLGTANGPFFLLLKADDSAEFLNFARQHRRHQITIGWRGRVVARQIWEIRPAFDPGRYRLTFALPEILADWILASEDSTRLAARLAKQAFLSKITIYRASEGGDELFQLEYDPSLIRER